MIVVSDTSPLNYLVLIQQAEVLRAVFGRVLAPPRVIAELQRADAPERVRTWARTPPAWLEIRAPVTIDPSIGLGPGEMEAISLAKEVKADAVLIDERRAAAAAKRFGLFVTGTLGVLEIAADKQLLALPQAIAALRQTSFRVSQRVLDEVLQRDRDRKRRLAQEPESP